PVFLHLGGLEIRYYGLIYVIGFFIAYFMLVYFSNKKYLDFTRAEIENFLFYIAVGAILGARLFYALVYNTSYYFQHLLEIFYVWHGGMSFHGGLLGAVVGGLLYKRKHNFKFYKLADLMVIPLALALAFGRVGNFINGELYGRLTSLPWGIKFSGVEGYRHPSQLYESFKNIIIFTTLWILKDKKHKDGFLFWLFITLYGLLRFFIEFVRAPDPQLGFIVFGLTMGQLLTLPMFVIGMYMILKLKLYKE
ncbi:prolipoprotein diacylglyceryl transferase, partial [Candidatus Woesearchaeota archaeon]